MAGDDMKPVRCDAEFAAVVMLAAQGDPADLATWLRSDRPLGPNERALLAELVAGELRRLAKRPDVTAGKPSLVAAVADYRARLAAGEVEKNALADAAKAAGVSQSTLRNWRGKVEARDAAIREALHK